MKHDISRPIPAGVQLHVEDIIRVERELGPLPDTATASEQANRFRLYQAEALIRMGEMP